MLNIILIGLPGSGKTTKGKELAKVLGYHFYDTDELIVETFLQGGGEFSGFRKGARGESPDEMHSEMAMDKEGHRRSDQAEWMPHVKRLYIELGEEKFRERERGLLESLHLEKPYVLATGGGMPLHPESRKLLRGMGKVVYLRASENLREPLSWKPESLAIRLPIYSRLADLVVLPEEDLVEQVRSILPLHHMG